MTTTASTPGQTGAREYQQLIGGIWDKSESGQTFESLNPYDGSVYARAPASRRADAARAVRSAEQAQPLWASMPPAEKQQLFLRAADILERRGAELVEAIAEETGGGQAFNQYQLAWSANLLRLGAGWVYHPHGQLLRSDFPHTMAYAERKPLGVVASFTPWNGALLLAWRAVVAPLAAGNTVVVKPSEEAPVTAGLVIGEVLAEAGFPAGTVNVVTHPGHAAAEIAEEFYENPAVRCLYFTGSAGTARTIAARAGASLKRSVMELGGYNQMVVLEDADLDHAVKIAAFSSFFHQGQICMNSRRILVARTVYDSFVERFVALAKSLPVGDPKDPSTILGPLINDRAAAQVRSRLDTAVRAGARVLTGGAGDGRIVHPTVVVDAPDSDDISCEETFGPVVVVRPVDSEDEAVKLVNASRYGLAFSVLTADVARGLRLASRVDSGATHVNAPTVNDEPQLPNGGVKESGWGRSGPDALDDFTEVRWVTIEMEQRALPL